MAPRPEPVQQAEGRAGSGENLAGPGEDLAVARGRLAEAQGRVVRALVAGGEVPDGFDAARLRAQAASLVAKRRSIVARLRPDAAVAAGADLAAEFAAYARARGEPPPGYRADADGFAAWLRERGRLPDPPRRRTPWWRRRVP
ncbi:hypothetical protein Nocox_37165 [Nonomuraea coxensis DSM 45129]|uniref:SCO6045-like C-terminal domain-containing protein n=1 Tax=Nonomuraea coxensis DSM 45129 TaxID=1122611 RepID=A0ABX8UB29_9ACTN|nr:hypothetical protein [Nonomuraea coxensis]QYC44987.1 hypothetical protein Nocox_37165 [Nonomuraea coxensis DSM 45129]